MTEYVTNEYYIDLWLEQEGKELLLERLSQWLTPQFKQDCRDRQSRMQKASEILCLHPSPLSDPQYYAGMREQHDRHLRLIAQHTQYINDRESERARADIAPPCPMLSVEHCTFAFEYVEAFKTTALASPLVQDVMDFLGRIITAVTPHPGQKTWVPLAMRECARDLLTQLLKLAMPPLERLSFRERTVHGYALRADMLAWYEWEYQKLAHIWKTHPKKEERLTALQKVYLTRSGAELNTWLDTLSPSAIAERLVAEQFTSTVSANPAKNDPQDQAIHGYLRQARSERDASAATMAIYRKMIDSRK